MSKQPKAGLAYKDATPQQLAAAKTIIEDAGRHRYYVSRIYTMFNAISGKNEPPQTCASCLRTRAREIKKWYDEGVKASKPEAVKAVPEPAVVDNPPSPVVEPAAPAQDPAAEGEHPVHAIDVTVADEIKTIHFTPTDGAPFESGVKGAVLWADGKKVNAGTYKTADGHDVKVQVGSKATYVENYDDLAS